ncbi:MAG: BtpA/SgcQ family protein [Bacteroidales bacterium]
MNTKEIFGTSKPVIGCIHLLSLPGSPGYGGNMQKIYESALEETNILLKNKLDGLIVENFRDNPFYPGRVPPETIAAMATVTREIRKVFKAPVGVNALRNDATAALSIALAAEADFIRVNIHTGAAITDQGIIAGEAHQTIRLRKNLGARILIFADVHVKHSRPLVDRGIELEARDLAERGSADALIVTGDFTGGATNPGEARRVKQISRLPVFIGSGTNPENLQDLYSIVDGFIVGSYFKENGLATNRMDPDRVKNFMEKFRNIEENNEEAIREQI